MPTLRLLEDYLRNLANQGKELYITAGGYGQKTPPRVPDPDNPEQTKPNPLEERGITIPERLWKVIIVLDQAGLGVADIGVNTRVIAVDMPNEDEPDDPTAAEIWGNWRSHIVNIDYLERQTNLEFLSNLPTAIQGVLKSKIDLSSNLSGTSSVSSSSFVFNRANDQLPIIKNSVVEESSKLISNPLVVDSPTQIGISQINLSQIRGLHIGTTQDRLSQASSGQVGIEQYSISQVGSTQVSSHKLSSTQVSSTQIRIPQIGPYQANINQVGSRQIGSRQVDSGDWNSLQISFSQVNSDEISLSSKVSLPQFLRIHGLSSEFTNSVNNIATTLWNIPLHINVLVTDLPTDQLAEAQITGFAPSGRPNSGILTLDLDAIGKGWFLDTTPWENSEFGIQNSETSFQAQPNSEASDKYDLLTTILHELGHLNGIIYGNPAFDQFVQRDGTNLNFIAPGITAQLTPDGSHLDATAHPHSLLNPTLRLGERKPPTALDLAILETIQNSELKEFFADKPYALEAPLSAGALLAILNGDFEDSSLGWQTRGDSNILNGQAILSENSKYLSNLRQTFTIPEGAKALQFTLVNTNDDSDQAPPTPSKLPF